MTRRSAALVALTFLLAGSTAAQGSSVPGAGGARRADPAGVAPSALSGVDAALALERFAAADARGRAELAEVVRLRAGPELVERAIEELGAGHRDARRSLIGYLERSDLGAQSAPLRARTLARMAAEDGDGDVRAAAVGALARIPYPPAAELLDGLFAALPAAERVGLARVLALAPAARGLLVERVRRAFAGGQVAAAEPASDDAVLAELLPAYGRTLAELPAGGERAADLLPIVLGARHPSAGVQAAAARAVDELLDRLVVLRLVERLEPVLAALAELGWDPNEIDYRRCMAALRHGADPDAALAPARRLQRVAAGSLAIDERRWRFYGLYFEAAGELAAFRAEPAAAAVERARAAAASLRQERLDLRPEPGKPSAGLAETDVDLTHQAALVELLDVLRLLVQGRSSADLAVLEAARSAHALALAAQAGGARTGAAALTETLDALLDRDLGPRRLLLTNERRPRTRLLALEAELGRALAAVAGHELPGFERPATVPARLADPLADPQRALLLADVLDAEHLALFERIKQLRRAGPVDRRALSATLVRLEELDGFARAVRAAVAGAAPEVRAHARAALVDLRRPSTAALDLALDLRLDGRSGEAIALCRRMLADLEALVKSGGGAEDGLLSARIEVTIGGAYTDEDLPDKARAELEQALGRLEALVNTFEGFAARAEEQAAGAYYRAWIARVHRLESEALTSLAVNSNVRLGDREGALAYFERAYALEQNDFMRVLLACYRARSQRGDEARALLREVAVAPNLYYNIACTWALLGERELALDFLARELSENHPSEGSLARQRQWARRDPDLAALRGDPRFATLVGE